MVPPGYRLPLSLRTSAHAGVAIRSPCIVSQFVPFPRRNGLPRRCAPRNDRWWTYPCCAKRSFSVMPSQSDKHFSLLYIRLDYCTSENEKNGWTGPEGWEKHIKGTCLFRNENSDLGFANRREMWYAFPKGGTGMAITEADYLHVHQGESTYLLLRSPTHFHLVRVDAGLTEPVMKRLLRMYPCGFCGCIPAATTGCGSWG